MQTKHFVLIGLLVVLGGAAIYFSRQINTRPQDQPAVADGPAEGDSQTEVPETLMASGESNMTFSDEISWLTDYDQALQQAKTDNKLVVIDFFATWCGPCKEMERTTFTDERVRRRMKDFVPLKIDVDRQVKIAARYGIEAYPTTAVVKADGKPVTGSVGLLEADNYLALLSVAEAKTAKKAD